MQSVFSNRQPPKHEKRSWRTFFRKEAIAKPPDFQAGKQNWKKYESAFSLKAYMVDTSARILFYVPAIGLWEKFAAGMENEKVFKSRALAVLVNLFAARLHGLTRELVCRITKTSDESSALRKTVADLLTGFIIGLATYAPILLFAGADAIQSSIALPFGIGFTLASGRIFGRFMDWWRVKFGTTPVFGKKTEPTGP